MQAVGAANQGQSIKASQASRAYAGLVKGMLQPGSGVLERLLL